MISPGIERFHFLGAIRGLTPPARQEFLIVLMDQMRKSRFCRRAVDLALGPALEHFQMDHAFLVIARF
jgi:hypothetical protein